MNRRSFIKGALLGGTGALLLRSNVAHAEPTAGSVEVYDEQGIDIYTPDMTYRDILVKNYRYNKQVAGIHASENAINALIERFWIKNCDRGVEIEDGAQHITIQHGKIENVPYLYSIGAHNHSRAPVKHITYYDIEIVNSVGFSVTTMEPIIVSDVLLDRITVPSPLGYNRLCAPNSKLLNSTVFSPKLDYGFTYSFIVGHPLGVCYLSHSDFLNMTGDYGVMQVDRSVVKADFCTFNSNTARYGWHTPARATTYLTNCDFRGFAWQSLRVGGKAILVGCTGDKKVRLEEDSHDCQLIACDFPSVEDRGANNKW